MKINQIVFSSSGLVQNCAMLASVAYLL